MVKPFSMVLLLAVAVTLSACNMRDRVKRVKEETAQNQTWPTGAKETSTPSAPETTQNSTDGKTIDVQVKGLTHNGQEPAQITSSTDTLQGVPDSIIWVQGHQIVGMTDKEGRARVTVPLGDQTIVISPLDQEAFKEARYRLTFTRESPDSYVLYVSPDRQLAFDHGTEVAATFNPEPQRITVVKSLPERSLAAGPQAFRRKNSVWQDGEVQIRGNWEAFYAWSSGVPDQCRLGTATLADATWYVEYPCPKPAGQLTITNIDSSGMLVSFQSSSGATGTFNLQTHEWSFSPK